MHRAILINFAQSLFELPCLTGRKGRDGTFPASACIKLTGTYVDTGEVGWFLVLLVGWFVFRQKRSRIVMISIF